MKDNFSIHILNVGDVKTNSKGFEYRHIVIEDINNHKKVDYIIFKNTHKFMWRDSLKMSFSDIVYPGKIISLEITNKFLKYVKSSLPLTVKAGDTVNIIVWFWSNWDLLPDDIRIIRSFEDQIWRFRSFPKANK